MGNSKISKSLTVGGAPDSHRKLPSLSPLTVCGVLRQLLQWIGIVVLSVVLCRLFQRVSVLSWSLTTVIKLFESFESLYTFYVYQCLIHYCFNWSSQLCKAVQ